MLTPTLPHEGLLEQLQIYRYVDMIHPVRCVQLVLSSWNFYEFNWLPVITLFAKKRVEQEDKTIQISIFRFEYTQNMVVTNFQVYILSGLDI